MELGTSYPLNQQKGASERLRWFQAAVAVHPANPATRNGLAVALHDNGDLDGAIAGYREAIKADPKSALPHYNTLEQKGKRDEAMKAYKRALELDSKLAMAHANLGRLHFREGRVDEPSMPAGRRSVTTQISPTATTVWASPLRNRGI